MKKIFLTLVAAGFIFAGFTVNAQNLKFGHINSQELLVIMPEYKQAIDSLTKVRERYALQEESLTVEINRKYNDLVEQQSELDSLILQIKFADLQDLQTRLQEFQQNAGQRLRALEGTLTGRIMDKLQNAVKVVAVELDLIYVFDMAAGNPIYASDKSINIVPMVKDKLGLN
jgi:outer membrane protein